MKEGIIYGLYGSNGVIRYIGQTVTSPEQRLRKHLRGAELTRPGRRHVCDWIRAAAPHVKIVVLERTHDLDAAERRWIAALRLIRQPLTNIADGGAGIPVRGRAPWNKGRRGVSPETSTRMAASARQRGGHPHTATSRKKLSDGRRGTDWIREAGRKGGFAKAEKFRGGDAVCQTS